MLQDMQNKTDNPSLAAKAPESTEKRASGASTRTPARTSSWGDHPPAGLVSPVVDLQAKGVISQPGDPYEQEADQVANQVMSIPAPGSSMISAPLDPSKTSPQPSTSVSCVRPMIQRFSVDEETPSTPITADDTSKPDAGTTGSTQTSDTSTAQPTQDSTTPGETSTRGLIVDDAADQLQPGQMKKSDFLAQLKDAVCTTTEETLKGTIWSAVGCPWVEHWFGYYSNRDSQQIERALCRYAPETAKATSASDYIPIICERVRRAITVWSTTGEVTGVPEGIELPGVGLMGVAGSVASGVASGVESVASGVASAGASAVSGVESALSDVGSMLFKGREGGAREASNPQAIQGQLGSGLSLDGGVRSHMESAFGADFSHVHVHTDATSAGLSVSLNARAFTIGQDVAFGSGEYRPGTLVGDALIAHELAHVVQQGGTTSPEPMQKSETTYGAMEEDADRSAVGAVVSLLNGVKGGLVNIAQNAMPTMRSGLGLQRCAGAAAQRGPTTPTPTSKPVILTGDWKNDVLTAQNISDEAQRRDTMVALVKKALIETGIQVHVAGSKWKKETNAEDYEAAPVLNFDIKLNDKTSGSDTERGPTDLKNNYGYFFAHESKGYAIIGPKALDANSPLFTQMYAEHELYHTQHHVESTESFANRELETWTHDFRNYFHQLCHYGQEWLPLIDYYEDATQDAKNTELSQIVDYYNNPPVPHDDVEDVKRGFALWLNHRLHRNKTKNKQLILDLESKLGADTKSRLGKKKIPSSAPSGP